LVLGLVRENEKDLGQQESGPHKSLAN
jgi:hypothetical protein